MLQAPLFGHCVGSSSEGFFERPQCGKRRGDTLALSEITRDSILQAIAEFDRIGRTAFLSRYGYAEARSFFVEHEGKQYDSKAIAGVAHGYLPGMKPLKGREFTGGETNVATKLRDRGFKVVSNGTPGHNPAWVRDELILALDLYMQNPMSPPGKDSAEIGRLSSDLGRLGPLLGHAIASDHRNRNGAYMKVMNFRRFDPAFAAEGKVGLSHGSKADEEVWNEFSGARDRLTAAAALIRSAIELGVTAVDDEPYLVEAPEGRLFTATHLRRERNSKLIAAKKRSAQGDPRCEGCGMSFLEAYGEHGRDFIEVHHTLPVHTLPTAGGVTKLDELALVCANCHRMIHRQKNWLSLGQLREMLASARTRHPLPVPPLPPR